MGDREHPQGDAERERIEAEFLERLQQEMSRMTVQDHLLHLLRSLPSMAFQYMGIYQTEGTKDLIQSRLAIDAFRSLLEVVAPVRAPEEVAMYRSTLAQMQMAYVTASQGQPGATPEAGSQPGASAEDDAVAEAFYEDSEAAGERAAADVDAPGESEPAPEEEAAAPEEEAAAPEEEESAASAAPEEAAAPEPEDISPAATEEEA